jgi:hypothetical protein
MSALLRRAVRTKVLLLALLGALICSPAALAEALTAELMPGVTYTREMKKIRGKQVVEHVVIAPKPGCLYRLVPVLSNETITGKETVSAMEERLSGQATAVGINGDLFNWEQGYPSGIFMRDGVLHGRPISGRSALGIGADGILRLARIGFFGTWGIGDSEREALTQLNRPLEEPGVALFTPAWGAETPRSPKAVDVVVSGFPQTTPNTDLAGQIVEVRDGGGTPIPATGRPAGDRHVRRRSTVARPGLPLVARLILAVVEDVANAIGGVGDRPQRTDSLPTTGFVRRVLPRHPAPRSASCRRSHRSDRHRRAPDLERGRQPGRREPAAPGAVTGMAFDAGARRRCIRRRRAEHVRRQPAGRVHVADDAVTAPRAPAHAVVRRTARGGRGAGAATRSPCRPRSTHG